MTETYLRSIVSGNRMARVARTTLLILCIWALVVSPVLGENPAPVQTFYVSLPEEDALVALTTINAAANTPMYTYFSIAVALDGTYVYYDQWEDGYASDIANPSGTEIYSATNLDGVQIWGNGEADDGCAPNINGVTFTCTDEADVLYAGNVIIPYNAVELPDTNYDVLDRFSTVSYSNNDGTGSWSGPWVEGELLANYRDEFGTAAYNNSNGSVSWTSSPWAEQNDGTTSPTAGTIYITNGTLRFREYSVANDAVRRAANLTGWSNATLSFTLNGTGIDGTDDAIKVQVSGNGGSTWTDLQTFSADPNGATYSYNISAYIASNTTVRFIMMGGLEADYLDGETWDIDDVDIRTPLASDPASGAIQVTGGQLRFTAAPATTAIDREVSLPPNDNCAQLSFTLGYTGVELDGSDEFRVRISSDGGSSWTTRATFGNGTPAASQSFAIADNASASTMVRFEAVDALEAGEYWSVDDVQIVWGCARDSAEVYFDARDKVAASGSIAMARAVWASGSGTLNAFGHEMYATSEWGTAYEAPVGTDTANAGAMFQYSALSVMASQNGTQVQIDADADDTYETTITLNEGESYLAEYTLQGARVLADKPVQVLLVTGDIGSNYASRDMNLLPVSSYSSSYWSPVGVNTDNWPSSTAGPVRLFLYNPSSNGDIYITCERLSPALTTVTQAAGTGDVVTVDLYDNSGAHCYASDVNGVATGDPIFGVGTVDSLAQAGDWSFTLFPDSFLTTDALVGLGLGKDPTETTSTENSSPLWVTTVCESTYIYVDWNNDGTADPVDTNGDGTAEAGSENGILVSRLQSVRLFEPGLDEEEYDQSGARVWSRTASGMGDYDDPNAVPGCNLALAWGQDPRLSTAGTPGLDVGTSIPPLRLLEGTKTLALKTDADGDGLLSPGDTAVYRITVRNAGAAEIDHVYVYDTVPDRLSYIASTTQKDLGSGWESIADDSDGTPFPLDVSGGVLLGNLAPQSVFVVTFEVLLDSLNPADVYDEILNCDVAYTDAGTIERCATTRVASYDWGDLPDSYGTSLAANGPRHSLSGLTLGTHFDRELQGQPSTPASDDDSVQTTLPKGDDEDGVQMAGTQVSWQNGTGEFTITVSGGSGCLNAWMDFTDNTGSGAGSAYADGDFTKTGGYDTYVFNAVTYSERIIQNLVLNAGETLVTFNIPPGLATELATNQFYFRFRLSPLNEENGCDTVTPRGLVLGGEVEDYQFDLDEIPTLVVLARFEAYVQDGRVVVEWETAQEIGTLGFFLYRWDPESAGWLRINKQILPALIGSTHGATYRLVDPAAQFGDTHTYLLQEIAAGGEINRYGPFTLTLRLVQEEIVDLPVDGAPYVPIEKPDAIEKPAG